MCGSSRCVESAARSDEWARRLSATAILPIANTASFKRRRSLAVRRVLYAITAALHFTKQVPRCMRNHEDKVWDKFEMSVLHGNTLGLVGYGDIAN